VLKGSFFDIVNILRTDSGSGTNEVESSYRIRVRLNHTHPIFTGHFPGNPVVPGACQIRMITEIISEITGEEVRLLEADNIKFLAMINPNEHPELTVNCQIKREDKHRIQVSATVTGDDKTFFKYKSIFKVNHHENVIK